MNKNNSNIDLGKAWGNLNKTLRNPGLIHRIQDALCALDGGNLMLTGGSIGMAIVAYRDTALVPLIRILHNEDRKKVVELIGNEAMQDIDEYMSAEDPVETGVPTMDRHTKNPDDIPDELFRQTIN